MTTEKDIFRFYTRNENLKKWLRSQSNQSEQVEEILNKFRLGELVEPQDLDYENRVKAAKLKKLEAEAKIKTWEADHLGIFDKPASSQAKAAFKDKAFRELKEEEVNQIVKFITLEKTFDGYRVTCLQCSNQFKYNDRLEALNDAARHLLAVHGKKIFAQ